MPNRETQSELFRDLPAHLPRLRSRALKLARNASVADDLVQETAARALTFASSYEEGTHLGAWLQQILFSVFVTHCRRRKREDRALGVLVCDPNAWTRSDPPAPPTTLGRGVRRALAELPDGYARAVELVDLGDCSYKDAAAVLEVPVGTVMSRLFRARRRLAATLGEMPAAA